MNVVLLVVDTLREKSIEFERGNEISPNLAKIAEGGLRIENYWSNSPWTIPSHATMFSGELPSEHGATTENPLLQGENRIAQMMKDRGFETVGIVENPLLDSETGFSQGFDFFLTNSSLERMGSDILSEELESDRDHRNRFSKYFSILGKSVLERDKDSILAIFDYIRNREPEDYNPEETGGTIRNINRCLESENDSFIFVNFMTCHAPYTFTKKERWKLLEDIPEEEVERLGSIDNVFDYLNNVELSEEEFKKLRDIYKASISYTDRVIGDLIENLNEDSILIVTSDHGELIGEHEKCGKQLLFHDFGTFSELVNVPFLVYPEPEIDIAEGAWSHADLKDILEHIIDGRDLEEGPQYAFSEYFGKKAQMEKSNKEVDVRFEELIERTSFSLKCDRKFEISSEGFLLDDEIVNPEEIPEEPKLKLEVLYNHV